MKKYHLIACALAVFLLSGCTKNEKSAQTQQTKMEDKTSTENLDKGTKTTDGESKDSTNKVNKTTKKEVALTKEELLEKVSGKPDDTYFADFNQDGKKEAFVIIADPQNIQKGKIVNFYEKCSIFLVNDQGKSVVADNLNGFPRGIFKVGDELLFFFEENAHGPGSKTRMYRVKGDKAEELKLPENAGRFSPVAEPFGEVMFKLDPTYEYVSFKNDYKDGEGRLDIPTYYDYNKETGEFVVKKTMTREEYQQGKVNDRSDNPLVNVKKEWNN